MSKEELLKPRYKVIADYPGSTFEIGEIIYGDDNGIFYVYEDNGRWRLAPEAYPAIFRPLQWWEEREEKDMPEYVKGIKDYFKGEMYKIAHPSQDGREWHIDHEIEHRTFLRYASNFLPATESEYNDYINSKSTKP